MVIFPPDFSKVELPGCGYYHGSTIGSGRGDGIANGRGSFSYLVDSSKNCLSNYPHPLILYVS